MSDERHGVPRDVRGARRPHLSRRAILAAVGAALLAGCADSDQDSVSAKVEALSSPPHGTDQPTVQVPVQRGGLPAAPATIPPVALSIPVMSLNAKVDAVGIDARSGDFAVPPSVERVGWYRYGPGMEAVAGSIVIAGHVDSAAQGKGAFFTLRDLTEGAAVRLTDATGRGYGFQVVGVEQFRKARIPLERYFARDGALRLTLITCGGPFDEATRHYRDNVVVTATVSG
ncbi:class F sortase [Catellatospora sp. KI3]|uniref:class F sortase n=1 Tax=Catellatospora sp. KI3 TaxID=3041620 RepID=UPI0024824822|nr:class F sortase [Catellatospora sp. KI3]MDI1463447.1 class F sortase [Catellatospora sp. KI3]